MTLPLGKIDIRSFKFKIYSIYVYLKNHTNFLNFYIIFISILLFINLQFLVVELYYIALFDTIQFTLLSRMSL